MADATAQLETTYLPEPHIDPLFCKRMAACWLWLALPDDAAHEATQMLADLVVFYDQKVHDG